MLVATTVSAEEELFQIHQLNQQNLKPVLGEDEKKDQGFVTWLYSMDLLRQMHELAPSVIVKDDEIVVGYALATLKEASAFHPDLSAMMKNLADLKYEGSPLTNYGFYLMGQVCIRRDYRGKGVFEMLYREHKQAYGSQYDLLVTEISTSNYRSLKAHQKTGFKNIYTYEDAMDEWTVVVWDWRKQK